MRIRKRELGLLFTVYVLACSGPMVPTKVPSGDRVAVASPDGFAAVDAFASHGLIDAPPGLVFELRPGKVVRAPPQPTRNVAGAKLPDAEADALLAHLPALPKDDAVFASFAKRPGSPAPPTAVALTLPEFPAAENGPRSPKPVRRPLEIVRIEPSGDVPIAPELFVSFNQAMIALASHEASVASGVPVKLSPQPQGRWRWLGTRTLAFTPEQRFPMATEYSVALAKGTRAADGSALGKDVKHVFRTPPPSLVRVSVDREQGPTALQPVVVAEFDQRIVHEALVTQTRFCWTGERCVAARAATLAEVLADERAKQLWSEITAQQLEARAVALVPVQALPHQSEVSVKFGSVPSAEGPRRGAPQRAALLTHGPLRVLRSSCGYEPRCAPLDPWVLEFSNPIATDSIDLPAFAVAPAVELRGTGGGNVLHLETTSRANTRYTLTLPAGLRDVFGQSLGENAKVVFDVGKPRPELTGLEPITVLEPGGPRALEVASAGMQELRVRVHRVALGDVAAYMALLSSDPRRRAKIPGTEVLDTKMKVADALTRGVTPVNVSGALDDDLGHAVVIVEPVRWHDAHKPLLRTWVQSTQLGLDVFHDPEHVYFWVTQLADGKPVANATVALAPDGRQAKTDGSGFARLALPAGGGRGGRIATARLGDDLTFYPERFWRSDEPSEWVARARAEQLRFFTFDDRGAYRPGETVKVKGWVRKTQGGYGGKLVLPQGLPNLSYSVTSSGGHTIARGKAELSAAGGFDVSFALPSEVDLGHAEIRFSTGSRDEVHGQNILIEEFRRPEYEVTLHADEATHFVGDAISVRTEARYYTGGPLAGARANFWVMASRAHFQPPNRGDYAFGEPIYWRFWDFRLPETQTGMQRWQGHTDAQGDVVLDIATSRAEPAYPHTLQVNGSVQDVNRQDWGATTSLLVHPGNTYVGLKLERGFISQGEALDVGVVAVDLDGKDVRGRKVEVRGFRPEEELSEGKLVVHERDAQTCAFSSTGAAQRCTFRPQEPGSYQLVARVYDDAGRPNETRLGTWVAGPTTTGPRALDAQQVQLIPDREEYAPGQTAEVLLLAPFHPADALVTIARDGVLKTEHVRLTGATHELRVPIEERHAPTLNVQVLLSGARVDAATRESVPAGAFGELALRISLASKRLGVSVEPAAAQLEPGQRTDIDVVVRSPSGEPVANAEVAVIVVDEAVLALTGHTPGDPMAGFFPDVPANVGALRTREFVRLAAATPRPGWPDSVEMRGGGAGLRHTSGSLSRKAKRSGFGVEGPQEESGAMDASARGGAVGMAQAPTLRAEFSPIALFAPKLLTAADGRARVELKLPDDLTRYRIFALASSGSERFGSGESTLTARKVLMVRPSPPRFLNFGDRFELPIVVENQSDSAQSVLVAARAANALFTQGRGRRIEVPARDRVEVRLPMATRAPGRALLQVAVQAAQGSDAAQLELPVWTPATDEAFATYGSLADEGAVAQPIAVPRDAFTEFGGLEISTSSTQLAALTDALLYVDDYPFDCSEQLASRVITLLALRDVLAGFGAEGVPSVEDAQVSVRTAIRRLIELQNDDGGFPWWERGGPSAVYNTLHVLHALVRARAAGTRSAQIDMAIERARQAIPGLIEAHKESPEVVRTLRAYTAYVDALRGSDVTRQVEQLWREVPPSKHGIEATGFMLSAVASGRAGLAAELVAALQARASETASTAQFSESYSDGAHLLLHSEQRSDAIALEGLMRAAPGHDLAPKLAKGLLAHRKQGRWLNTQENVFAALALRAYFDHYERETPSFEARAFLGSILAQSARYQGRTTQQTSTHVPMAFLAEKPRGAVVVQKLGQGRMYYRLGLRYAPKSLALRPEDQGFEVTRSYEGADDAADVARDASGSWQVKAGARVRVRVSMVVRARRHHVALVDPLAAGFEPIQASLRVNVGPGSEQPEACPACLQRMRWAPWYEHENLRDERAEAFSSLVSAGVYSYDYTVRATTPGEFVVPPANAEEMYMPETFGRSGTDRVVIR